MQINAIQALINSLIVLSVMLPTLFPSGPSAQGGPVATPTTSCWTSLFLTNPTLRSALTCQSLRHWRVDCNVSRVSNVENMLEMDAIKSINRMLRDPVLAISDIAVLGVLSLVCTPVNTGRCPYRPIPFLAPLQEAPWLNIQGVGVNYNLAHANGLRKMLEMRGDLSSIRIPGLAAVLT